MNARAKFKCAIDTMYAAARFSRTITMIRSPPKWAFVNDRLVRPSLRSEFTAYF